MTTESARSARKEDAVGGTKEGGVGRVKPACPVCGDTAPFALWVDDEPPGGCPYDEVHAAGGDRTINVVTECLYQMKKARQQREWRKQFPDQFDDAGNIKPGGLAHILERLPQGTMLVI